MKKLQLKTFSTLSKKKKSKISGKTVILKTDRTLFGRMIVIAQSRNLQMQEVFTHALGPLPWALATPEGDPRKTAKAALATSIQKLAAPAENVPANSATVIDGMSLVQRLRNDLQTFGDVATALHGMVLREGYHSTRVDVVFDVYNNISIKNTERANRGETDGFQLQNISDSHLVRQWRHFLKHVSNKSSLIQFLVGEWQKPKYTEKLQGKILYVTHREHCWKITNETTELVPELTSQHEEADGRILLHAAHAAEEGYACVVVCSEDTDVLILSLAFSGDINVPLLQKCGTQTRTRLVDVGKIAAVLGSDICKALLGMHAFSGCDTVSAFAGKGKQHAFQIIKSDKNARETFMRLGEAWTLSPDMQNNLERFTCKLYATKPGTSSVDQLRYNLFCARKGEIESHQLPPCKDSLSKHSLRANYQAGIWRRSLQANPETPNPNGRGWKMDEQNLVIDWMDGTPAPEAVLNLLSCTCSRSCKPPSCACISSGLKCTDMCRLRNCTNQPTDCDDDETDRISDNDASDDDEDDVEY